MLGITNIPFDQVGAISSATTLEVTDSSADSHTITAGKKAVILQIVNGSSLWFGGDNVDPANYIGNILLPRSLLIFRNVKSTFKIYFKAASGKSGKVGINEMD